MGKVPAPFWVLHPTSPEERERAIAWLEHERLGLRVRWALLFAAGLGLLLCGLLVLLVRVP